MIFIFVKFERPSRIKFLLYNIILYVVKWIFYSDLIFNSDDKNVNKNKQLSFHQSIFWVHQ